MNAMTRQEKLAEALAPDNGREAMRRWDELKAARAAQERDWEDMARLIRPQRGGFGLDDARHREWEKPLSSIGVMAQTNFAAGLYGTMCNPANRWMGLKTSDPKLNDRQDMREWLDDVSSRILASFRPSVSPFYSAAIQLLSDVATFGNAAQYDELVPGERRILDVTLSLAEVCFDIDAHGQVAEVVRRFRLKPRAAVRMFAKDNLPEKLIDLATKGALDDVTFYHHVKLNYDYRAGRIGPKGKRWLSIYACEIDHTVLRSAGYDEMPFQAPRWEVESGMTYGTGPGFTALASARVLQRMDDATIRAAQFAADPVRLAGSRDDWPLEGEIRPGQVVYNGLNMQGNPMLRAMDASGNIGLTLQEKQQKIEEIRDAFHWTLMSLAGRSGMTATETMAIMEERTRNMAPHLGRMQEEYFAPKISRRFALLWKAGQLPPPPVEAEGVALEVDYLSAAAMAQRSTEGAAITRVIADIAPLAAIDQRYMDRLDPDAIVEALQQARGGPAAMLRSREETDAQAQQRQQAQAQAQQMEMMQAGAGVAKDAAAAAQTAGLV